MEENKDNIQNVQKDTETSKEQPQETPAAPTPSEPIEIYTLRTTVGRENVVIEAVSSKSKYLGLNIKAFIFTDQLKGYIFVEGSLTDIQNAIQNTPHIRGVISKPVKLPEIDRFLGEAKVKIEINIDDIVEIVGGPFKGEKGKVLRINEAKDEVTLELVEATVPIPVTVTTESIRILESKAKREQQGT